MTKPDHLCIRFCCLARAALSVDTPTAGPDWAIGTDHNEMPYEAFQRCCGGMSLMRAQFSSISSSLYDRYTRFLEVGVSRAKGRSAIRLQVGSVLTRGPHRNWGIHCRLCVPHKPHRKCTHNCGSVPPWRSQAGGTKKPDFAAIRPASSGLQWKIRMPRSQTRTGGTACA